MCHLVSMCGRFTTKLTWREMMDVLQGFLEGPFRVDQDAEEPPTSFNIKPTQHVSMLTGRGETLLTAGRWWFVPHWFKGEPSDWKQTTFNARIETASEKPTFRTAWASHRCAIPASGYFEWTGPKSNRVPWYISAETNAPTLFFAGLASTLPDGTRTCTILTRAAAPQIQHLHDRMPVILTSDQLGPWIKGEIGTAEAKNALGAGWDGRFQFHRVAPLKRESEGPEVIEPFDG